MSETFMVIENLFHFSSLVEIIHTHPCYSSALFNNSQWQELPYSRI